MPFDWEPCPGNTHASDMSSPYALRRTLYGSSRDILSAMSPTESWPAARDVHVFVADALSSAANADRIAQSIAWMSPAERERLDRFRHEDDRVMFAIGRIMARTL